MASPAPFANQLRQAIGRSWWLILLFGIMSTLFGVMALVNPVAAGASLTWAIGILAIAHNLKKMAKAA